MDAVTYRLGDATFDLPDLLFEAQQGVMMRVGLIMFGRFGHTLPIGSLLPILGAQGHAGMKLLVMVTAVSLAMVLMLTAGGPLCNP